MQAHTKSKRPWGGALLPRRGGKPILSSSSLLQLTCGGALMFVLALTMVHQSHKPVYATKSHAWFTSFQGEEEGMQEWLRGCKYIYLDVGSNRGIQVRKIFEPNLYPEAEVLPHFQEIFGKDWQQRPQEFCAVGFEANPHNTQHLQGLQAAYRQLGWRVHFFTETAVALKDGKADFYLDSNAPPQYHQPGSTLVAPGEDNPNEKEKMRVHTVDLARYILEEVMGASSAGTEEGEEGVEGKKPIVVMKLDVEGSEHEIVPHLVLTGALCKLHTVFYERHLWGRVTSEEGVEDEAFISFFEWFARERDHEACPVNFLDLDDETYDTSVKPLPRTKLR